MNTHNLPQQKGFLRNHHDPDPKNDETSGLVSLAERYSEPVLTGSHELRLLAGVQLTPSVAKALDIGASYPIVRSDVLMAELIRLGPHLGLPMLVDIGHHHDGNVAQRRLYGIHAMTNPADAGLRRAIAWAREIHKPVDVGSLILGILCDVDAAGTLELAASTGLAPERLAEWVSARLPHDAPVPTDLRRMDTGPVEFGAATTEMFAAVVELAQGYASGGYLAELGVTPESLRASLRAADAEDAVPPDIRRRGRDRMVDGTHDRDGDGVLAELALETNGVRLCLERMGTSAALLAVTVLLLDDKPEEADLRRADRAVIFGGLTMVVAIILVGISAWNGSPWLWALVPLTWPGYPQNRLWIGFASAGVVVAFVPWAGAVLLVDALSDWLMSRWQRSGLLALTGIVTNERDRRLLNRTAGSKSAEFQRFMDVFWRIRRNRIPDIWDELDDEDQFAASTAAPPRRARIPRLTVTVGWIVRFISSTVGILLTLEAVLDQDWAVTAMGAMVLLARHRALLGLAAGAASMVIGAPMIGLIPLGHLAGRWLMNVGADLALLAPGDQHALEVAVLPLLADLPPVSTLTLHSESVGGIDEQFDGPVLCDDRVTWCAAEALVLAAEHRSVIAPDLTIRALANEIGSVLPMSAASVQREAGSSNLVDRNTLQHVLDRSRQGPTGDITRRIMVLKKLWTPNPQDTRESKWMWELGGWHYALLPPIGVMTLEKWRLVGS